MISKNKLRKIEEKIKEKARIQQNYQYIFSTHEEYEKGKLEGKVNPEGGRIIIIDA